MVLFNCYGCKGENIDRKCDWYYGLNKFVVKGVFVELLEKFICVERKRKL